ncbi:Glucosaminyl phosphatidylinositol (GlcN-PI) nositol acylation protein, partial [Clydaea vesicula]
MQTQEQKLRKEKFVSNNVGSKISEINLFLAIAMDLGVGCVVFSSGLVAGPRLKSRTAGIFSSIKTSSVLLLIGLLRALFTKSVNYQEHVSEYGIHWNFFFTLGSVSILVSFLQILFPQVKFSTLGYTVALVYEYLLHLGLENYILNAPRVNLISMNKEGIFSLFEGESTTQENSSYIITSVNRNPLVVFIIGNVMTGLVNLTIDTLSVSSFVAFIILVVYIEIRTFFDVTIGEELLGRLIFKLYPDLPKTVENFSTLCRNKTYVNAPFHRIIDDFMIQGGDYTK